MIKSQEGGKLKKVTFLSKNREFQNRLIDEFRDR